MRAQSSLGRQTEGDGTLLPSLPGTQGACWRLSGCHLEIKVAVPRYERSLFWGWELRPTTQ